ncbi:MAG: enoyl-CoA hydratase/isomerase family protein [Microthrixaceae bacterium]
MDTLQVERSDGVVTITLDRPHKKNAINRVMWDELLAVAREVGASSADRCVVLTGAGDAFCSGADLSDGGAAEEPTHQLASMRRINAVLQAFHDLPQPTLAKVTGVAAGVGFSLALGCDLLVASDTARFSTIFAKRGLSLDGGQSWLLPRLVGMHRAKQLALFADVLSAQEALSLGIINRVVPAAEIDDVVDDWSARLSSGPPIALAMTKRMLNRSFEQTFEQALDDEARCQTVNFGTRDTVEAITAFIQKRTPRFEGR